MTDKFIPRPLHLHTIESLCADLASGRAVSTGIDGNTFCLEDDRARSALEWYRARGPAAWTSQVSAHSAEHLVDSILQPPPVVPVTAGTAVGHRKKILTLKRLEAHRFAGLHRFGTPDRPPPNFILEFSSPIQLFEGANGSGKTSLVNAIIWALTGDILRPQREPEKGMVEFTCRIDLDSREAPSTHKICQVTPLPDPAEHVPEKGWVYADTWVELTFADETGKELGPVRRTLSRTPQGKIYDAAPSLDSLGIDPISFRIGTVMPGLLPAIRVGSESELGKAVAQLTGLSALADLSDHVRRARSKIDKEFVKREQLNIERADESYGRARTDVLREMEANESIRPTESVPVASVESTIESTVDRIHSHFLELYTKSVLGAKSLLGDTFDPKNSTLRGDLENNIGAALNEVRQLKLDSLVRLKSLRVTAAADLAMSKAKIVTLIRDAATLDELSRNPTREARVRLYALVALWIQEHPGSRGSGDECIVCGSSLEGVKDPVTSRPVKQHIHEARSNAALMSQTLKRWSEAALGELTGSLPIGLRRELEFEGPEHPCDLIRTALSEELFATQPFEGVLCGLKVATTEALDLILEDRPPLSLSTPIHLPASCVGLQAALMKLDRAIRFAEWRQSHDEFSGELFGAVIGRASATQEDRSARTLTAKLSELDQMVKSVAPLTRALRLCELLKEDLKKRRTAEKRVSEYTTASAALQKLLALGDLADLQVARLRQELRAQASKWRDSLYQAGFPAAAHNLLDTRTSRRGHLELIVGSGGISAPAHHVTNASALRASLVGFYIAFFEYVLKERGGLRLMMLDDPEELFDEVNRERLAETLPKLVGIDAQIVVTTHDRRFAGYVARLAGDCGVEHRSVHPATTYQPVVRTPISASDIGRKKKAFEADPNSEEAARDYAGACRVHIETMLSDLFDDPAYSPWPNANSAPTFASYVDRIRGMVKTSPQGIFSGTVFRAFVEQPGVATTSATYKLLNKPHHQDRRWITPTEVAACGVQLDELVDLADRMHDERRQWRHRSRERTENVTKPAVVFESLESLLVREVRIPVCPDLAAFTRHSHSQESQAAVEYLDPNVLKSRTLFYLRRDNFGFAALQGSVAIVKSESSLAGDRSLVIARDGAKVYARRVMRGEQPGWISLAGETPDPRRSPRTRFFRESEVALHEVVGVLFRHGLTLSPGADEAILVEDSSLLDGIEIAYRVTEESAIPLALPRQIALGGEAVQLDRFAEHVGELVALTLQDGSSLFKRVGEGLPGDLSHLREFESIGGLGSSRTLAVGKPHLGFASVVQARVIIGVLYGG
jgi:hypothetical protein